MRISKRILALLLALTMCLSLLSANIWAAESEQLDKKANNSSESTEYPVNGEDDSSSSVIVSQEDTAEEGAQSSIEWDERRDSDDSQSENGADSSEGEPGDASDSASECENPKEEQEESEVDASTRGVDHGEACSDLGSEEPEEADQTETSTDTVARAPEQDQRTGSDTSAPAQAHPAEEENKEPVVSPEAVAEASVETDEAPTEAPEEESVAVPSSDGAQSNSVDGEQSQEDGTLLPQEAEESTHFYAVFDLGYTWSKAKVYCESKGGHLATITSASEQKTVEEALSKGTRNCYWLGGYKENKKWCWVTDEAFQYTKWAFGQPDNYKKSEDKLMIYRKKNPKRLLSTVHQWNDLKEDCTCNKEKFFGTENFGFVCEWDASLTMDEVIDVEDSTPTTVTAVYFGNKKPQNIAWGMNKAQEVSFGKTVVDGPEKTGVQNMYWIHTTITVKRCNEYQLTLTADGQTCESTLRVLPTIKTLTGERHVKSVVLSVQSVKQEADIASIEYVVKYGKQEKTVSDETIRIDKLKRNTKYEFKVRAKVTLTNGHILEGAEKTVEVKTVDRPSAEDCWEFKNPSYKIKDKYFKHYFDKEKAETFSKDNGFNGKTGLCFGMCLSAAAALNATSRYCNVYNVDSKQLPKYKTWESLKADDLQKDNVLYAHAFQAFEKYQMIAPYVVKGVEYIDSNNDIETYLKGSLDKYLYRWGDAVLLSMKTGGNCHTVWAMDYYENEAENRLIIYIYDPNLPGELRELTIDQNGKWDYQEYGGSIASADDNTHLAAWGLLVKMSVNEPRPETPQKLKATAEKGKLTITWNQSRYCTGYNVQCATDKQFTKDLGSKTLNKKGSTSVTFKNLKAGKTYYVRVWAVRENRVSDFSKVVKAKVK